MTQDPFQSAEDDPGSGDPLHRQMLDASPIPFVVLDADRRVVQANERAREDLGLEEDELLGLGADDPDVQVLDEDGDPIGAEETTSARMFRTGEPVHGDVTRVVLPTGHELWLSVSGKPITDADGTVTGAVLAFEDITERKQRERELRVKNQRLEDLAGVISHEFRNPLQIARGFTEMARESGDPDHFEKVETAHERMGVLVDRLLDLSKATTVGERTELDLAIAAERAWGRIDTADATVDVEEGLPTVTAAELDLLDLFEHLFKNAVEHGSRTTRPTDGEAPDEEAAEVPIDSDGGGVTVTVGPLPDGAGFYVADDGVGIAPEEREGLFEGTPSARGKTGSYGLEVVRTIVDEHGWTISYTESATGGARFEIRTEETASETATGSGTDRDVDAA